MTDTVIGGQRVAGKVAVVTGGGSGIGEATARRLAAEGGSVVVADVDADNADRVAADIRGAGGTATAVATDVGEPEQVKRLIDETVDTFGGIDILHNNAAAMQYTYVDPEVADIDLAVWNHQLAVNLTGAMVAAKHAIPHMIRRGGGSIIHTGSVESIRASESRSGYSVTKSALLGLSRSIAVQYGKHGVRSNVLMPGPTFGEAVRERLGPMLEFYSEYVMAPDASRPADQASVVVFLASDESWFLNGQAIAVDGAMTAYLPLVPAMRRRDAERTS